ncbi:hypothetical protein [Lysobacter auxotrophicus]|uniref:YdbH domain-containing protein n=1 Tax=Lysobacter auxotrophicus TaxID=2992573 RepID=A0ABN6UMS2_9GAMM|nr:hypothetical protein [Lysobacter auxotrophicus]BDU17220.1 YdbH domain-containing protein [Lysobacter auxotrophicus]
MSCSILRLLLAASAIALCAWSDIASAATAKAKIAKVSTAVATLEGVRIQLDWPDAAPQGTLRLQAARIDAPGLGYRFRDVAWQCPLSHAGNRWRCEGPVREGRGTALTLGIDIDDLRTGATLSRGSSRIALDRRSRTPELTRIDLAQVPVAWAQALVAEAWEAGRFGKGTLDGQIAVHAPSNAPLRVSGPLRLTSVAFDTADGLTAGENVSAQVALDATFGTNTSFAIDGALLGGDLLFGNAYLALQRRRIPIELHAMQQGSDGWRLSGLRWDDAGILVAHGSATLGADGTLRALDVRARSDDLAPMRDAYLTGFLGLAGLADLQLRGAADVQLRMDEGTVHDAAFVPHGVAIDDPRGRFDFAGLEGDVRFSRAQRLDSELRWSGGRLHGLAFGAARLPFVSDAGELRLREASDMAMLGGNVAINHLHLRPPADREGLEIRFGLDLDRLDIAQLSQALGWPAFTGELTGHIPEARYAQDRLDFEGGLSVQLFGGTVQVSSLAMERPFGVAPTLSSDIAFEDIDLQSLTGVLGFGEITGKLDGRFDRLRLVDWQPVSFEAAIATDADAARRARVRQRISQRAVQDLSSVSDASFVSSLQSQLIGLFDDFGYRRIGLSCYLDNEVCRMSGLGSAGNGFTIVEGSGLPRLAVVGFNRDVDWPTLLDRLKAASSGDVKPVFE